MIALLRAIRALLSSRVPVVPHLCEACEASTTSISRRQYRHRIKHGVIPCRCGGELVAAWRCSR